MAGSKKPEKARDAMQSIIAADTPALFAAIDSEFGDGIVLEAIARYYHAPLEDYDTYPCMALLTAGTVYFDELRAESIQAHDYQLQLYALENEGVGSLLPQEVLTKRIERSVAGIVAALEAKDTLDAGSGPEADWIQIGNINYSQFVPWGDAHILRGALIPVRAHFDE